MTLVVDLIDKRRQVAQRLLMLHIDRHSHIGPPEDFAAYNAEITECQRQIQEINNELQKEIDQTTKAGFADIVQQIVSALEFDIKTLGWTEEKSQRTARLAAPRQGHN
ncbi:MAG: hypothetical protein COS76_02215 [Candidatus Portnoybacteria bacterium CG06_land_8_20_14_3_00_39_12]|uniref:Uncharacterized protein n=3 Tax=Candidatus Portnoyibacteriota TaxID=1817913 RepID=A0A2M8KFK8_9BACT|nr:MAG: hypothetical protein AUJ33_02390 [Parcubacteria group bacterium CG1_02_40_25]PIU75182.1 MAG: hypothetical protein COS76_02215 [Candidatus Portnoybacteria bacterium CG06_land_8_20_14_3_00_39_12]PIZ71035.1 MAG: hypothetical protein COY09_01565 [Candidatus Portnoybacteria bacterium CG_4_10_14_0_2_um_filter_39_11]PJE58705.1 MAG: hypothetical protein COU83_02395 [Candidatus Portnoybacteria bacterium CG10_big_fil_rev_8_21_14_0_10_40_22]